MMGLCLAAAAMSVALPLQSFTLAWTHSIEKIRWEEDYRVTGQQLELVEARIRGSGAGMEPPEGAVLRDGVWHYKPTLHWVPKLHLQRSEFVKDYELCWDGACHPFKDIIGSVAAAPRVEGFACRVSPQAEDKRSATGRRIEKP